MGVRALEVVASATFGAVVGDWTTSVAATILPLKENAAAKSCVELLRSARGVGALAKTVLSSSAAAGYVGMKAMGIVKDTNAGE